MDGTALCKIDQLQACVPLLPWGLLSLLHPRNIVVREGVEDLETNHEEADTLICAHIKSMDDGTVQNVVVRASDTDIAVIMVHHS